MRGVTAEIKAVWLAAFLCLLIPLQQLASLRGLLAKSSLTLPSTVAAQVRSDGQQGEEVALALRRAARQRHLMLGNRQLQRCLAIEQRSDLGRKPVGLFPRVSKRSRRVPGLPLLVRVRPTAAASFRVRNLERRFCSSMNRQSGCTVAKKADLYPVAALPVSHSDYRPGAVCGRMLRVEPGRVCARQPAWERGDATAWLWKCDL